MRQKQSTEWNHSDEAPALTVDIGSFLNQFGGNVEAAVRALRNYSQPNLIGQVVTRHETPKLIEINHLTKTYKLGRQRIQALNDVSFDIYEGEFVAITAPSGSGKSTLLQLMGGLEKPTSGTILVGGTDINSLSDAKLSKFRGETIGFIFQFFYLQPFLNVRRNIAVPGMFSRSERHERYSKAADLARIVGISDRLRHLPKELSGGQIQRVAIARALLNGPKLILADEPTGNLDVATSQGIIELFKRIRADFGTTIIIATHDQAIASQADRILHIEDGVLA